MKWQSVDTRKGTRCRVLEGGSGAPLVFFHSAGGLLADNPFLERLAQGYQVFAPEWPGYGDSSVHSCTAGSPRPSNGSIPRGLPSVVL